MHIQSVDKLEIQVLVDNVTDSLSSVPDNVTHEMDYLTDNGMEELSGECLCCGAHGLSLLITAFQGNTKQRTLLFDAGPEGEVFKRNVNKLNAKIGAVEAVVLSHGHWDHAGGFLTAAELIKNNNNGKEVIFHLNPGMFYQRATTHNGQVCPFKKIPSIDELKQNGADVVCLDEARLLLDDFFYLSGEIPRTTSYEKGFPGHVRQLPNGEWQNDQWIMDERFLVVNVRNKGLIVFSACSHARIINVLKHTQKLFSNIPIYAVMGGFHLSGHSVEKIIPQTVNDMQQFNLEMIIPAHCTGWRAVNALGNKFSDKVVPSAVGRIYRFNEK